MDKYGFIKLFLIVGSGYLLLRLMTWPVLSGLLAYILIILMLFAVAISIDLMALDMAYLVAGVVAVTLIASIAFLLLRSKKTNLFDQLRWPFLGLLGCAVAVFFAINTIIALGVH